jgi:hypothetical protein
MSDRSITDIFDEQATNAITIHEARLTPARPAAAAK